MSKIHHPRDRADRLRIKAKKDFGKVDRAAQVQSRIEREALEQKEILDELRREVYAQADKQPND